MEIEWAVEKRDIDSVRKLLRSNGGKTFVRERYRRNVSSKPIQFSRERFWCVMIGCLLTTQQRSGPDSAVGRLMRTKPFPLALTNCEKKGVRTLLAQKLS